MRANRGAQPTGEDVREAEHRPGREMHRRPRALASQVTSREEQRARGERAGTTDRSREEPENEPSPDRLFVPGSGREREAARRDAGGRQRRDGCEPNPPPREQREQHDT